LKGKKEKNFARMTSRKTKKNERKKGSNGDVRLAM
jgi:hypothetical protein